MPSPPLRPEKQEEGERNDMGMNERISWHSLWGCWLEALVEQEVTEKTRQPNEKFKKGQGIWDSKCGKSQRKIEYQTDMHTIPDMPWHHWTKWAVLMSWSDFCFHSNKDLSNFPLLLYIVFVNNLLTSQPVKFGLLVSIYCLMFSLLCSEYKFIFIAMLIGLFTLDVINPGSF